MTDYTYTKNQNFLSVETCQCVWSGEVFMLPGFDTQDFKFSTAELNNVISDRTDTRETFLTTQLYL